MINKILGYIWNLFFILLMFGFYTLSELILRVLIKYTNMQRILKYALVAITIFSSCKSSYIIPQKDLVSLLVRIHLIDATVTKSDLRTAYFNKDTIDYYGKTIQSFGYSQAQFDSSLKFYSKDPKQLDAIYDKVIIELSRIETKITADNKSSLDSILKDTLRNLWNLNPIYELPTEGKQSSIDFKIPTIGPGTYTISAEVLIYPDDQSAKPSMVAYFYFDDQSTEGKKSVLTTKPYQKSDQPQVYIMQMELHNSLVTHLRGSLFLHSTTDVNSVMHARVSNISVSFKPLPHKGLNTFKRTNRKKIMKE
jgi:hypothetical protein